MTERKRIDVLEEIDRIMDGPFLDQVLRPGTSNSDVNAIMLNYPVPLGLLHLIKREITKLREAQKCP